MAMQPVSGRKPRTRKVTVKSASHALDGPERPFPVYQFSNRTFIERPGHNPFTNLGTQPTAWGTSWGTSWGSSWNL